MAKLVKFTLGLGLLFLVAAFLVITPRQVSYAFLEHDSLKQLLGAPLLKLWPSTELKGEKEGRVNILILGVSGKEKRGPWLTDSIFIVSLPTDVAKPPIIIGIPRDLLIKIPERGGLITKINSLYILGKLSGQDIEETRLISLAVKEVSGLNIHYSMIFNLEALRKIVETLGGIQLFVSKDIYDPAYPTEDFGTTVFDLNKGWHYFNEELVEKYIRTRAGLEGDFGRMRRQIEVLNAILIKIKELNLVNDFPTFVALGEALSQNFQTDLSWGELKRLWELLKNRELDFRYFGLSAQGDDPLLTSKTISLGGAPASVLWPRAGKFDYREIQSRINHELQLE